MGAMGRIMRALGVAALAVVVMPVAKANPVVSNVNASQRQDGSGLVDIHYDLSGGMGSVRIEVSFSNDNGANWNVIPTLTMLTGDVGNNVPNGNNRHIVWDAGRDRTQVYWPQARARVRASALGQTTSFMLPGGIPLQMVRIPGGSFSMGSPLDPPYSQSNEAPVHTVTIDYDFFVGRFQVTQEQWYAVMAGFPQSQQWEGNTRPVHFVSWNDAQDFVTALNNMGLGGTFRLPSDSEWEYACRAGTSTRWHFGDDPDDLADYAWYSGNNSPSGAKPVGQKLPNAFGLYDMHGNVREWAQDRYKSNYVGAPTDGSAWEEGGGYRVVRGRGYDGSAGGCRSASRNYHNPENRDNRIGVRVLWTP